MYTYICIYVYIYIYTYVKCIHIHVYTYIYIYICNSAFHMLCGLHALARCVAMRSWSCSFARDASSFFDSLALKRGIAKGIQP